MHSNFPFPSGSRLSRRNLSFIPLLILSLSLALVQPERSAAQGGAESKLFAGFAEADITPGLNGKAVYMAGFGLNRKATAVHDPLLARVIVLKDDSRKVALVSVDLVGLFLEPVQKIRTQLPGFDYVLVSSTHNHEGPDTLGLWGPHPFKSGVDPDYLALVEERIVQAVRQTDSSLVPVRARIGKAQGPELLHDSREPQVKHDELVALSFHTRQGGKLAGLLVQWNCHPETLGSRNQALSADFVGYTVNYLRRRHHCPVVYFTGTVGGLMTSLDVPVQDEQGNPLQDGTVEKTRRYGELVGRLAEKALGRAERVELTPLEVHARQIFLPIDNRLYVLGWQVGVLKRQAFLWKEDISQAPAVTGGAPPGERLCIRTEIALLRLGQLLVAAIPGEIYPELVLDRVEDPAQPGADYPEAPVEPAIYPRMKAPHRMLIGLANDEIGYILPRRQWDAKSPFCYGRKTAPYGEINSLGPETGPLLCGAFRDLALQTQPGREGKEPSSKPGP